jgi:hypothetical protein
MQSKPAAGPSATKMDITNPKDGYEYPATAAHLATESSTRTDVNVCTTDDFTESVDAFVYYIKPRDDEMRNPMRLPFVANLSCRGSSPRVIVAHS